jgi:hypothetical protein
MLDQTKRVSVSKSCINQMNDFFQKNEIHKLIKEVTVKVLS